MLTSFVAGAVAGWAIAIPVGAIGILIIELGIRRGLRPALAAASGTATADGLYAALAVVGGSALATTIEPLERPLRIAAVVILAVIAGRGLLATLRARRPTGARKATADASVPRHAVASTYLRFLGLTLLNPATVIYFAALILGLPDTGRGPGERAAFVVGAFLASLSWQWTLAGIGAVAHHRLPTEFRVAVGIVGNLVIGGFALLILLDL